MCATLTPQPRSGCKTGPPTGWYPVPRHGKVMRLEAKAAKEKALAKDPRNRESGCNIPAGVPRLRPQVCFTDLIVLQKLLGIALHDDAAGLQHIGAVGDGQGQPGVLLDEQNRHTAGF